MPITFTPDLFIKTLAAMLDAERDRKAVSMRSQALAMAQQFMNRAASPTSGKTVVPNGFQHRVQPNDGLQDSVWV